MEIQNYPNYLIYIDGRVQNKKTKRFLKQQLNKQNGYYKVQLYKNSKKKNFEIHRLLALHYIQLVDGKDFVDHIDRNKTNNDISNLGWVNNTENQLNCEIKLIEEFKVIMYVVIKIYVYQYLIHIWLEL